MIIPQFVVDAFTSTVFQGNPAAVCLLDYWLEDSLLQSIAAENNLSETAFVVPIGSAYQLRWFTPITEIDLCGHATLAAAHVLFEHLGFSGERICFFTKSGELLVGKNALFLEMLFPRSNPSFCSAPIELQRALGGCPVEYLAAEDFLVIYPNEKAVAEIEPDFALLERIGLRGVIVSAPGESCDFVSRFFAPKLGINEDPVTGSAHCQLAPYWAKRLGKNTLKAVQISKRRGEVGCQVEGEKILLSGRAVTFLRGEIYINTSNSD